jgi:hypothetical protein
MAGRQMTPEQEAALMERLEAQALRNREDAQKPLGDGSLVPYFPYPEVNIESAWKNAMAAQVAALREDVAKLTALLAQQGELAGRGEGN